MEWFESLKVDDIHPSAKRWSRWDQLVVAVLAATLLVALVFMFLPLMRQRRSMELQLQKFERELQASETQVQQLHREISALQTDAAYIERVARDKLNLAAPGETLYQFDQQLPAQSQNKLGHSR